MKRTTANARSARTKLRKIARSLVPPLALNLIHRARQGKRALVVEWEVLPEGFEQARRNAKIKGWDEQSVLDSYAGELPMLRAGIEGGVPFGLKETSDISDPGAIFYHNLALCWGWVLGRAAAGKSELSVLDWGGALGQYYLWARALQPDLKLDYTIKEVPLLVERGAHYMPEIRFRGAEVLEDQYDLLLVASALHYEEEWRALLARLLGSARHCAFLTRIPIVENADSFVIVQRPYAYGYETEYASWCFNRQQFIAAIESCGWRVEREVITGERFEIKGAPCIADSRGFLLRRASEEASV